MLHWELDDATKSLPLEVVHCMTTRERIQKQLQILKFTASYIPEMQLKNFITATCSLQFDPEKYASWIIGKHLRAGYALMD